jgi:hypothetical protein
MDARELVYTVALVAIFLPAVAWVAKRVGRWFMRAIAASLADAIRDVMKPDLDMVRHSINAMQDANTRDHNAVQVRLANLEQRQGEVESRLAGVEAYMTPRSPDA